MEIGKGKILLFNTLTLVLCVVIISLFCFVPVNTIKETLSYKIVFDTNGGEDVASLEIDEGKVLKQPDIPTRDGYVFLGWYLDGEPYNFDREVTKDMTLVAKWKEMDPEVNYYTVYFDTDGGSLVSEQIIEEGSNILVPAIPEKNGFIFVEWRYNGVLFDYNTPITEDITLVAVWQEAPPDVKTYRVTFNSNGGSAVAAQTIEENGKVKRPPNPTRNGYTFVRWNYNNNEFNFNTEINRNITLVAVWNQNQVTPPPTPITPPPTPTPDPVPIVKYTVSFDLNGGSGNCPSVQVESGKKVTNVCNPTRKYYNFGGWSPNINNAITGNTKFTAQWNKKTYLINAVENKDALGSYGHTLSVSGSEIPSKIVITFNAGSKTRTFECVFSGNSCKTNNSGIWNDSTNISVYFSDTNEVFSGRK